MVVGRGGSSTSNNPPPRRADPPAVGCASRRLGVRFAVLPRSCASHMRAARERGSGGEVAVSRAVPGRSIPPPQRSPVDIPLLVHSPWHHKRWGCYRPYLHYMWANDGEPIPAGRCIPPTTRDFTSGYKVAALAGVHSYPTRTPANRRPTQKGRVHPLNRDSRARAYPAPSTPTFVVAV